MLRGLRAGIEKASSVIVPLLCVMLVILLVRALTLPGAMEGVRWYILKFELADLTPAVVVGAMGQMMFPLSLGGTFMVVYGSYMKPEEGTAAPAIWTTECVRRGHGSIETYPRRPGL
jgi:NSS family neurotransmitter:Na+ symporter